MLQSMGMQRVRHYLATEQQEPTIPGPFQGLGMPGECSRGSSRQLPSALEWLMLMTE